MASIHLNCVYSCPADNTPTDINLPAGWQLAWHQLETLNAIRDPDIDVVFNTAMTGDGKSLAAYLDVLQGSSYALGLYPTNALAKDQEEQIRDYIAKFEPRNRPRVNRLSGPALEVYAENEGLRKSAAIATRTSQSEVLITNPDIFHYLHRGAYLSRKENPDKLWNRLDKDFDLFIFDEFHVFAAPQIASVLNTLLLIRATNRRKKFLFLSATPNDDFTSRLAKAGFRYRVIDPKRENKYRTAKTPGEVTKLAQQSWRQVAHGIDLSFIGLESVAKASETWLKENQTDILQRFIDSPGSKGAIILNSIAAVKRLVPIFKDLFATQSLTVKENTGLSGQQEKADSLNADLVIGTSTIDVGVDFKINFLVFESSDAGNFIQRLGRLGRHDGYNKDGRTIQFDSFRAYALVPNFFVERLFDTQEAVLVDGEACDRIQFHQIIRENYRQINNFEGYYKAWGGVQSFDIARQLQKPEIKAQYQDSLEKFWRSCENTFDVSLNQVAGRIRGWAREWQSLSAQTKGNPIAEDARSFRGSSPLQCGLYDLTEPYEPDRFKTYDLTGILSNLDIEMWNKSAFLDTLQKAADRAGQPIAKGRFRHCLAFMKLHRYREERLNWSFTYPGDLQPIADSWKVQVLLGLQVWQPDNAWISLINRKMKQKALVAYVLRKPTREVRQRLRLPMHFQIYPISDASSIHDANAPYSIAFGQSALLLDTLAYWFKREVGELWIA